jgi:hypothetical protein
MICVGNMVVGAMPAVLRGWPGEWKFIMKKAGKVAWWKRNME